MPWLSLAAGVFSAVWMDRSPERAWLVAAAAAVMWVGLAALAIVIRRSSQPSKLVAAARFSAFAVTQSMVQVTLFFVLPFFWRAATLSPGHLSFVGVLALAAGLTLWDPVFAAVARRAFLAVPLLAVASFAGLAAALPALGLSHHLSLWISVGASATMAMLTPLGLAPAGERRAPVAVGTCVATVLVGGLLVGGAKVVPAAPLRLVVARIGTRLNNKRVSVPRETFRGRPQQLVCATAIWAPWGLRDQLFHVWRHDGEVLDRIPLKIEGGRKAGFRTWSIKKNFGANPAGHWSCGVETRGGQHLGRRGIQVIALSRH